MSSNAALLAKDKKKKKKKKKKDKKQKDEPITIRSSATGTDVGPYRIGHELGRGGFGFVYQGLDTEKGIYVAIKQVYIKHVPKDELDSIKMEIELLKKLKHENIVQYINSVEEGGTLNIVLEFVEGGSLQSMVSKMGVIKEPLVLKYLVQVLEGLAYLHRQGVIHRDIKGANLLTTKHGVVKLADFGVSINVDETASEGECVVGTPYWMAPEIIKMEGVTAKCDIWSVGCVVIELLTGKPPYFELAPMAALFRIVQDVGGPPLPIGISRVLRDFLGLCFMSSAEARKSAEELLQHPWCASLLQKQRQEKQHQQQQQEQQEQQEPNNSAFNEILEGAVTNRGFISVADHQNVTKRRGTGGKNSIDSSDGEDWDAELEFGEDGGGDAGGTAPNAPEVPFTLSLPPQNGVSNNNQEEDPFGDAFDDAFDEDDSGGGGGLTLQLPTNNGIGGGGAHDLEGLDDMDDMDDGWGEEEDQEGTGTPDQQSAIVAKLKKQAASRRSTSVTSATSSNLNRMSLLNRFKENNNDGDDNDDAFDLEGFGGSPHLMVGGHGNSGSRNNQEDEDAMGDFGDDLDLSHGLGSPLSVSNGLGDDEDFDLEGVDFAAALRARVNNASGNGNRNNGNSGNHGGGDGGMGGMGDGDDEEDDFDMTGFGDDDDDIGAPAQLDFGDAANFESDSLAEIEGIQIDETYRWLVAVRLTETEHERDGAYQAVCQLLNALVTCPLTAIPVRRISIRGGHGRSISLSNNDGFTNSPFNYPMPSKQNVRLEQLKRLLGLVEGQKNMLRVQFNMTSSESSLGPMYVLDMMNITHVPTRIKVLEILYMLIESDPMVLHTFILIGVIPEIIRISIHSHDVGIQTQTSKLVHYIFKLSKYDKGDTMRTFIACGGLPMLVNLMRLPYEYMEPEVPPAVQNEQHEQNEAPEVQHDQESQDGQDGQETTQTTPTQPTVPKVADPRPVVRLAIDCARRVLLVDSYNARDSHAYVNVHKNEMCRKFAQAGMLPVLTDAMLSMIQVAKEDTMEWLSIHQLVDMLNIFCSHGDIKVKTHVVESKVMRNVLKIINLGTKDGGGGSGPVEQLQIKVVVEQLVKGFTMLRSPAIMNALQKQHVIPVLVSFLPNAPIMGRSSNLQNMAMTAIYHLCRLSPLRQEEAAVSDIVPRLKHLFQSSNKVFALEVFCDLARTSDACREELSKHGGVDVYLEYMDDRQDSKRCLTSLTGWLSKDIESTNNYNKIHGGGRNSFVEKELLRPFAIDKLIHLFKRERTETSLFEAILTPMLEILSKSPRLNRALGRSPILVDEIAKRLVCPNNIVRMNLLRMLKLIMEQHSNLKMLIVRFDLYPKIQELAGDSSLATVSFLAGQLLALANVALFGNVEEEVEGEVKQ